MNAHAHHSHAHHGHGGSPFKVSAQATLHCLTGCVIGEVAGVAIGVSLDDYYFDDDGDDENIGFLSAGIAASIPLPLPEEYGTWSLNGSATYVQMVAESLEAANCGDDNRVVGKVGVGFTY